MMIEFEYCKWISTGDNGNLSGEVLTLFIIIAQVYYYIVLMRYVLIAWGCFFDRGKCLEIPV